ncbi:MAG: pyridoxamine 5'-phosphate oxidase family protein [Syntrophothermus sp.]
MLKVISRCLLAALFILPGIIYSQNANPQGAIPRDSLIKIARKIIDSAGTCMLITVDENNKPHARVMDPFTPDEHMVVRMGTNPNMRKVEQIKKNQNVVVFYYDKTSMSYVTLEGKAKLLEDAVSKTKYFKSYWDRYYPNPESDFVVIEATPERMEVLSYQYNMLWNMETGTPANFIDFAAEAMKK